MICYLVALVLSNTQPQLMCAKFNVKTNQGSRCLTTTLNPNIYYDEIKIKPGYGLIRIKSKKCLKLSNR